MPTNAMSRSVDLSGAGVEARNHESLAKLSHVFRPYTPTYAVFISNFSHEDYRHCAHSGVQYCLAIRFRFAGTNFNRLLWSDNFRARDIVVPLELRKRIDFLQINEADRTAVENNAHIPGRRVSSVGQQEIDRDNLMSHRWRIESGYPAFALRRHGLINNSYNSPIEIDEWSITGVENSEGNNGIHANEKKRQQPNPIVYFLNPFSLWLAAILIGIWGFGHRSIYGFLAVLSSLLLSMSGTCMFLGIV